MDKKQIAESLIENGLETEQAQIVADCFYTADLYGVTSHGAAILPSHIDRIKRGGYNLNPDFKVERETAAFALIDGDNSMGPVCADYCMNYAIEKCKDSGVFTVFSKNNNTFGPAFYYPLKAAEKGYIGFICSNSPAQMPLVGGAEKMLGTNPFSAVIPVPNGDPIIIDMATSVVAKSKFKEYKEKGQPLPEGWALDVNGNPTTDPDEAIKGFVLPFANFKGYSIAMLIDLLAGALSGAAFLNKVGRFYCEDKASMNVGFFLTVIDPYAVYGEDWGKVISDYVKTARESKTFENEKIALPGDDRIEKAKKE